MSRGGSRPGAGRPTVALRGTPLQIRLTEDEAGWLRAHAEERATTVSGLVVGWIEDARRREMETTYRVVPAGTRDVYAAGAEARFSTMEEAEAAIESLRAMGGEWDREWDVIEERS